MAVKSYKVLGPIDYAMVLVIATKVWFDWKQKFPLELGISRWFKTEEGEWWSLDMKTSSGWIMLEQTQNGKQWNWCRIHITFLQNIQMGFMSYSVGPLQAAQALYNLSVQLVGPSTSYEEKELVLMQPGLKLTYLWDFYVDPTSQAIMVSLSSKVYFLWVGSSFSLKH